MGLRRIYPLRHRAAALAVSGAVVAASLLGFSAAAAGTGDRATALNAGRGIGAATLQASRGALDRHFGSGRSLSAATREYHDGGVAIEVTYNPQHRAIDIQSPSASLEVFGVRLTNSVASVETMLKRHGWREGVCGNARFAFTTHHNIGTSIVWRSGHFQTAAVLADGTYTPCPGSSPGQRTAPIR